MANTSTNIGEKWYFTKEQLENTPSRKCGFDAHKELSYRQQAANFIQEMGQRLKVSQLCINTAIVYMHRFYVFHSFTHFPWYQMAAAALFLAAKVEEQPRKLEYVIRIANVCRNSRDANIDVNHERFVQQSQDLVFNENVLLQTLGFDVAIDHPHTHVVRCCHLVRASKDLAQTSYFMASNSLHLTTMCIQYKPTVVACFCILVACKWSNWEIPLSNEKKEWYSYVDPTVTRELLQQLTEEFLVIFEACPSRLKVKIMAMDNSELDYKKKEDGKPFHQHRSSHESKSENDLHKHRSSRPHDASSSSQQQQRERDRNRDRERLAVQQKAALTNQSKVPHGHHRPSIDQKLKPPHSRPPVGSYAPNSRQEPRDILREAPKDSPFGLASKDYREHKEIRTDKDVQKRDYLLKSNISNENSFSESRLVSSYSADKRIDPNRVKIDSTKVPVKHEPTRRPDETKTYLKSETENIKKHLSASLQEKNNSFLNKSLSSTSQKMEKIPDLDVSKSVLKPNLGQIEVPSKSQNFNGSDTFNKPLEEVQVKTEPLPVKEEPLTPQEELLTSKEEPLTPTPIIKRPSLFSPEQTPPHKKVVKTEPEIKNEPPLTPSFSPLSSPITIKRDRNCSTSSSEPELRPVMKKIDLVEGFENLIRDTTIGIHKINPVSDIVLPILSQVKEDSIESSMSLEVKPSDIISTSVSENNSRCTVVNGLETNPTMISNLLKEAVVAPHLSTVSSASETLLVAAELKEKEHHHHKSKKKNKEKHKHKDKDRSREDKEKKKKHKDKDREKHKHRDKHQETIVEQPPVPAEPIKLKIQKDRIQPVQIESIAPVQPIQGLKIKIPKDKLKTEAISELVQPPPPQPTIGIKLKIPKEKLNNCVSLETSSRKRDRERTSPGDTPPNKIPKTIIHKSESSKQNGRHPYNKVTQSGDGDTSLHRLAESKYTHKSSTS